MDFMMNKLSELLEKFGSKLPALEMPWNNLAKYQAVIDQYLSQANVIFPVGAILTMLIAYGTLRAVLLAIWVIKFIRDLLPF